MAPFIMGQRPSKAEHICIGSRFCYKNKMPGSDYCHFHGLLFKALKGNSYARRVLLEMYGTKVYTKGEIKQWNSTS